MSRNTCKGYSFPFNLGEIRNLIWKYCWKFLTLFFVFWNRHFKHFSRQINPAHLHSETKYCQKLLNTFTGETAWRCIVSFLILLSYKWRRICFKSYGRSSSWENSNFQQYIFLLDISDLNKLILLVYVFCYVLFYSRVFWAINDDFRHEYFYDI